MNARSPIFKILPGLGLSLLIALAATGLGRLSGVGPVSLALLIGLIAGNLVRNDSRVKNGILFSEKRILETAVVFIGFGLSFNVLAQVAPVIWLIIGVSVIVILLLARLAGKLTGLSPGLSILLGAGSAICGTAAIAAIAPLLRSKDEETGLSIGVINLLGTLGLVLLPMGLGLLSLENEQSALVLGGTLQSLGHVTGAAFSLGPEVGQLAVLFKMGRILWLIPLLLILFFAGREKTGSPKARLSFPLFIPFFMLAVFLTQTSWFPTGIKEVLIQAGDFLLIVAMAAIGFRIRLKPLFKIAGPALATGSLIFILQIALFLLAVFW